MTDKILWQSGDALNETNLSQTLALKMISNYVERGLSLSADWANNNFDVGSGMAVLREDDKAYPVFADARTGISLPSTSGMNYVYLGADIAGDTVSIHVDADDTPPSTATIKLGELDASAETVTETNRNPSAGFNDLSITDSLSVGGELTASGELIQQDTRTRVTGFDGASRHWTRNSVDDSDLIYALHRNGQNDYDMYLKQGGENREVQATDRVTFCHPEDDLVTAVNSDLAGGDELVVYGTHTIDTTLNPPDNTTLTIEGKVSLADSTPIKVIHRYNPIGVTIQGNGTIDGNKNNLADDGARDQSVGIHLRGYPEDITIRDVEVQNCKNACIAVGGGDGGAGRFTNLLMENVYAHDSSLPNTAGDVVFLQGDDMRISNCLLVNGRDTHLTPGNCTNFTITGCVAYNTDWFNNNIGVSAQIVALGTQGGDCFGTMTGNVFGNAGAGQNTIDQYSDTNMRGMSITGNYLFGTCQNAMHLSNSREVTVSGNFVIGANNHGILIGDGKVVGNIIRDCGGSGIYTENGGLHAEVLNNTVMSTGGDGIAAYGGASKVMGNWVLTAGGHGIRLGGDRADHCAINNHVGGSTNNGIQVGANVTDTRVSNNRCVNNGFGIGTDAGTNYNVFLGNIIRGNTNSGFSGSFGANSVQQANIT